MSAKMGRPTDSPKTTTLQIRVNNQTLNKLDSCAEQKQTTRSEIVRQGIEIIYNELKK